MNYSCYMEYLCLIISFCPEKFFNHIRSGEVTLKLLPFSIKGSSRNRISLTPVTCPFHVLFQGCFPILLTQHFADFSYICQRQTSKANIDHIFYFTPITFNKLLMTGDILLCKLIAVILSNYFSFCIRRT